MKLYYLDLGSKGVREGYIEATETEDAYVLVDNDLCIFRIDKNEMEDGLYFGFFKRVPTYFLGLNRGNVIDSVLHRKEEELWEHIEEITKIRNDIKSIKILLRKKSHKYIDSSEIPPEKLKEGMKAAKEEEHYGVTDEEYAENYARGMMEGEQEISEFMEKLAKDGGSKLFKKIIHDKELFRIIRAIYGM